MKTTRRFIGVIALLSVLSCQKGETPTGNTNELSKDFIITCSFENNDDTKTTIQDEATPLWSAGDEIMLYDGSSNTQKLTIATNGTPSSTTGIIDVTDARKFLFVKPDGWTEVYAIYPYSACVTSFSASVPKINFAGQDGTFGNANICAAKESSGTMSFKSLGAILRFLNKPSDVQNIVLPVAELANDYQLSFSEATPSLSPVDAANSNDFTIGDGTGATFIGVPASTIAKGSAFVYRTSSKNILGYYITGGQNTTERNRIYTLPDIVTSDGKLPGVFSVSKKTMVRFSKGNLYSYSDGDDIHWKFEDNQYDYADPSDCWGYFGWSTASTTYGMSNSTNNSDYSGEFVDWGSNSIENGGNTENIWRTLSGNTGEWNYLLSSRSVNGGYGEGKSYQRAKIKLNETDEVYGLIIYPDDYTDQTNTTSYQMSEWLKMESAGCVFLPAAGYRSGTTVIKDGTDGFYWSSTKGSTEAKVYGLSFSADNFKPKYLAANRTYGYSVRLVADVE